MGRLDAQTFGDRLLAADSRASGFDYMRISLALLVLVFNAATILYGQGFADQMWRGPLHPFIAIIGPMFFSLSGFLIAGSLNRCKSIVEFIGLRILRLVPALLVAVLLIALLLGPIFTTLHLGMYFTDLRVYEYLLNLFGALHLELPGVFATNSFAGVVNMQLWVLPREVKCYVLVALMSIIGVSRPSRQLMMFFVLLHIIAAAYFLSVNTHIHDAPTSFSGYLLLLCFVDGVSMYVFRRSIASNALLFAGAATLSIVLLTVPGGTWFASMPVTYVTVYLGLRNPRRSRVLLSGDYSYGVFLYGFPVQQAVVAAMPSFGHFYLSVAIGLPCTLAFAVASWWLVERPMQGLRPLIGRIGDDALAVKEALRLRCIDWVRRALSNE